MSSTTKFLISVIFVILYNITLGQNLDMVLITNQDTLKFTSNKGWTYNTMFGYDFGINIGDAPRGNQGYIAFVIPNRETGKFSLSSNTEIKYEFIKNGKNYKFSSKINHASGYIEVKEFKNGFPSGNFYFDNGRGIKGSGTF